MAAKIDIQKLVQISKMYYEQGLTQEKISKELGISRSAISMMLTDARKMNIVDIRIIDPYINDEELSSRFKELFGLEDCFIVPTNITKSRLLLKIVTSRAAAFAAEKMRSDSTVGIAWGLTCYEFIQQFPADTGLHDINVVPLIGGSALVSAEFQVNETVRLFAEKLFGSPLFIYAPGMVEFVEDKKNFLESLYMKNIIEKWANLDFAILGIGSPPEYYGVDNVNISAGAMLKKIERDPDKPIGDFTARWFNIRGEVLDCEHNDKLLAVSEADLRKVPHVMGVACGTKKVFSIFGALNSGILSSLVIDELCARGILDLIDSGALADYMRTDR